MSHDIVYGINNIIGCDALSTIVGSTKEYHTIVPTNIYALIFIDTNAISNSISRLTLTMLLESLVSELMSLGALASVREFVSPYVGVSI